MQIAVIHGQLYLWLECVHDRVVKEGACVATFQCGEEEKEPTQTGSEKPSIDKLN